MVNSQLVLIVVNFTVKGCEEDEENQKEEEETLCGGQPTDRCP